jgi:IstB-like ATP binding protein
VGGLARGDSRYTRMLKSLARMQVLILDDWGITPLTAEQRRDLLEIFNDRHGRASGIGHFGASAPHKLRVKFRKYHKSWENSSGSGDLPDSDRPMTNLIRGLMTPT